MDQAAAVWASERAPGEDLHFSISGGEPFLDLALLTQIVGHGARLGAVVGCVTNAFWASSDVAAHAKLSLLKDAGLRLLAVSTSRFHQDFVRRQRVERALRTAESLGLRTVLKCSTTQTDFEDLERWAGAQRVDHREIFPVTPYLRRGAVLDERNFIRSEGLPGGRCPGATLTVREDGRAYTCCMPGAFTDFHSVGNTYEQGLGLLYDRFCVNGKQQVLRDKGPAHFAAAVVRAGEGHRLRAAYEGVCDLCAHIGSDPVMAAIAENTARAHARRQAAAAIGSLALRALKKIAMTCRMRVSTTLGRTPNV
jgi:MoaA/NifB/PqqE/SkfB family radical SAM enzyme